ncbi:MAG TPA: hypothetical protein VMI56_22465 [Reyranella sp.]|nr:hypothetical protein [Reyranella sp.]
MRKTAEAVEARFGRLHNLSMAVIALGMAGTAIVYVAPSSGHVPEMSFLDPRMLLFAGLSALMLFYGALGIVRTLDRKPQVVIDRNGLLLRFGRFARLAWNDVQWVRLRRAGLRLQLQIGLTPEAFVKADLRLSSWNLDNGLKPVRGVPAALVVSDNSLDTSATVLLDAVRRFRPNLVKP